MFTISRQGDVGAALTVAFTLTGTATNGVDYGTTPQSVVIPGGASSVEVTVTPIDDTVAELPETVVLTLVSGPNYDLATPAEATALIVDNELPELSVSMTDSNAFESFNLDRLNFRIQRTGDTNAELFIEYTMLTGTATPDVDFTGTNGGFLPFPIYMGPGEVTVNLTVEPINDVVYEGNEVVGLALVGASGQYTIRGTGAASGVITDDELPPARALFADTFDFDTSADWTTMFGANNGIYDAQVTFAFDYGSLGIPLAPSSGFGLPNGLFLQVNKTEATALGAAGVNLYPKGRSFSGNFALRFDLFLNIGTASTTEHALLGLNHSGTLTNRVTQSADTNSTTRGGDGFFVALENDGSANREYSAYSFPTPTSLPTVLTNRSAAAMAPFVTAPPYAFAGSPGVNAASSKAWSIVELGQIDNVITLRVNNSVVYSITNTTGFTNGNIMVGYSDQFDSVGSGGTTGNFAVIDNVRVVSLDFHIFNFEMPGNQVIVDFASPLGGQVGEFLLQSSPSLSNPVWTDVPGVTASALIDGFRFEAQRPAGASFFRIRR